MVDEAFASRLAGNSDVVWRAAAAVILVNALAADLKSDAKDWVVGIGTAEVAIIVRVMDGGAGAIRRVGRA